MLWINDDFEEDDYADDFENGDNARTSICFT